MKKIIFSFVTLNILFADLNIDINSLINYTKNHPKDIQNRLIIAKYYLKKGNIKIAKQYLNQVLKIDPNNKNAIKLENEISYYKNINYIQSNDLNNKIDELYKNNKYKKLISLAYSLKKLNYLKNLNDTALFELSRVSMWEGKYNLSLEILNNVKNKKNLDFYEIKAYNLYYLGKYKNAEKYFNLLYKSTNKKDYLEKLLNIYYYLGETNKLKNMLMHIKQSYPLLTKKYQQKLKNIQTQQLNKLINKYESNPTFENLEPLVTNLYTIDRKKAFKYLEDFIKTNPNNNQAKMLYAKLLSWSGNYKKVLQFLEQNNIQNIDAKLLIGKILAWQGEYNKALIYLSDVFNNGNQKQKYQAEKMIAYIYLWENDKQKAKEYFKKLYKLNPNDEEVKEELLILNGNITPLISKYKKLVSENPDNYSYLLKLANLYNSINDYKNAIKYYEKYLQKHPSDIKIYKILGDLYLKQKNIYKGFSNWEYYANVIDSKDALLELAKRYYWYNFNKEAISVLNEILKKYPNYKEAIELKAKILKITPRYVEINSAETINDYFNSKAKNLKELGIRAYNAQLYPTAIDYFKKYLFIQPNDYDIREKYAYALENNKEYKKAAGEYFLLMWYKKTPQIEYHYAYNLQKSGELKKAEKIYKKLLNEVPKPAPEFIKNFLNNWKNAWESMDFNLYSNFYDKKIKNNIYWRLRKQSIFKKASFISVGIYDPLVVYHKNDIYKIKFFQVYASKNKKDKGYKYLTLKCIQNNCLILKEKWKKGKYIPFNPSNSLETLIKKQLVLIKKNSITKIKINDKNKNALNSSSKKNDKEVVLPEGIKKNIDENNVFVNINFEKVDTNKTKNFIQKKFNKKYRWELSGNIDYFKDNQKTDMLIESLSLKKQLNFNTSIYTFFKNYRLKQNNNKKKGLLYGIGLIKNNFLIDIFNDNSGKKSFLGWHTSYKINENLTFNLNKTNLVYSRKTICSSNHSKIKAELTSFSKITNDKDLWWSLAYEHINDKNNVITPQFEADLYKLFSGKFFFAGWYQFNSKHTSCYYSPKKTDNNIIGYKISKKLKNNFSYNTKLGLGYSFFDNSLIYVIKAGIGYTKKQFNTNLNCEYSNSSPVNKSNNYKSYECYLDLRYLW